MTLITRILSLRRIYFFLSNGVFLLHGMTLVLELEKSITNFLNLLLVNDIYYINGINSRYFRNRLFSLVNEYKRNEIFR